MPRKPYKKIFQDDPDKLNEMILLRLQGWSLTDLEERYGIHHDSIMYQFHKFDTQLLTIKKKMRSKKEEINLGKEYYLDYLQEEKNKEFIRLLGKGGFKD